MIENDSHIRIEEWRQDTLELMASGISNMQEATRTQTNEDVPSQLVDGLDQLTLFQSDLRIGRLLSSPWQTFEAKPTRYERRYAVLQNTLKAVALTPMLSEDTRLDFMDQWADSVAMGPGRLYPLRFIARKCIGSILEEESYRIPDSLMRRVDRRYSILARFLMRADS